MKIFNFLGLSIFCSLIWINFLNAGTECTATSTYADHTGVDSAQASEGEDGYCSFTPDSLKLRVFEFGLCTGANSPTNKANCETMFKNSSGTVIDLAVGSTADIVKDITLTEGTYTNAYLVLSTETSMKAAIEFSASRTDSGGGSGTFCFTNGDSVDDGDDIITCSNTNSAQHSIETIKFYDLGGNYVNSVDDYTVTVAGSQTITDLYMIDSSGNLSTGWNDDFAIYGDQTLNSPVTISATTSGLDIAISVTNGVAFGFYAPVAPCPSLAGCPGDALFAGLKFNITAN